NDELVWTWSLDTTDGPAQTQVVTITATDKDNVSSAITFEFTVENVAPTARLQTNSGVTYGSVATATLVNPFDPSPNDTSVGFHYAFALDTDTTGSATYANTAGSTNSANFGMVNAGRHTVYARIIDKDGG